MSADAVALFRPKTPTKLKPFLDLDDESEESDGLYAEELEDGAVLVHTFQPFSVFEESPSEVREWLSQFGDALPEVHEDARGLLFFPDTCEPEGRTYDAVVKEVADAGVWVAISGAEGAESGEQLSALGEDDASPSWPTGALPPIDMNTLQAFAGQLLGDEGAKGPITSFDVAKLFKGVQEELFDALGMTQTPPTAEDGAASEGDDEPAASSQHGTAGTRR